MIDSQQGGQALQKASNDIFHKMVSQESKILQAVMNESNVSILQQKDVRSDWDDMFKSSVWRGSECLLGKRILYRNNPVGCVILFIDHFSEVEKRDKNILKVMSDHFSSRMERLDKISELSQRSNFERHISDIFSNIDLKSNENDIYQSILPICRTFCTYDKLTISIADDIENQARVSFVDGAQDFVEIGLRFSLDKSLHGLCIDSQETILSKHWNLDFSDKTRFDVEEHNEFHYSSVLLIPFQINNHHACIGLERVSSKPFHELDLYYANKIAEVLSWILLWKRDYNEIHKTASHDGLTGLLNHRYFKTRFEGELNRAVRFNQTFVLAILDIDKFKRVNDTYGHYFGDYVIKIVAQIIKDNVRNIDVLARYGGEEYALILVDTTKENAKIVANRIVKSIDNTLFQQDENHTRLTISIGLAEFPNDSDMEKGLIEKADAAMYEAKKLGGNTFCIA